MSPFDESSPAAAHLIASWLSHDLEKVNVYIARHLHFCLHSACHVQLWLQAFVFYGIWLRFHQMESQATSETYGICLLHTLLFTDPFQITRFSKLINDQCKEQNVPGGLE